MPLGLSSNSNVFGSCIIHILYKGCAKIKKKSGAKKVNKEKLGITFKIAVNLNLYLFTCIR